MNNTLINIMSFFGIYQKILSKKEMEAYLDTPITDEIYKKSINGLWTDKQKSSIMAKTEHSKNISQKYLDKMHKRIEILKYIPFIRGVAVVNTVAFFTADEESDIDLFIIAEKNHLWTVRLLTTITLHLLGVRRHKNKIAGRLCLSFFADTDNLNMEKIKLPQDPFLAFWTSAILPIFGKKAFQKMATENKSWVKKETGIVLRFDNQLQNLTNHLNNPLEKILGNWSEKIIKKILLPRTLKKAKQLKNKSGTIISDGLLKFHDQDQRAAIAEKYFAIIKANSGRDAYASEH